MPSTPIRLLPPMPQHPPHTPEPISASSRAFWKDEKQMSAIQRGRPPASTVRASMIQETPWWPALSHVERSISAVSAWGAPELGVERIRRLTQSVWRAEFII